MTKARARDDRPTDTTAAGAGSSGGPPGPFDAWLHRCLRRCFDTLPRGRPPPDLPRLPGEAEHRASPARRRPAVRGEGAEGRRVARVEAGAGTPAAADQAGARAAGGWAGDGEDAGAGAST